MTDIKQISNEIAKAIFDRIEQDRMLILSNVADVIHKELAVRMPERKEPDPVKESMRDQWEDIRRIIRDMDTKAVERRPLVTDSNPWWSSDSWIKDVYLRQHEGKTFKELYEYGWDVASDASSSQEKESTE